MENLNTALLSLTSPCTSQRDYAQLVGQEFEPEEGHSCKIEMVKFAVAMDRNIVAYFTISDTTWNSISTQKVAVKTPIRVSDPFAPLRPIKLKKFGKR